jgi:hypothetical protein
VRAEGPLIAVRIAAATSGFRQSCSAIVPSKSSATTGSLIDILRNLILVLARVLPSARHMELL